MIYLNTSLTCHSGARQPFEVQRVKGEGPQLLVTQLHGDWGLCHAQSQVTQLRYVIGIEVDVRNLKWPDPNHSWLPSWLSFPLFPRHISLLSDLHDGVNSQDSVSHVCGCQERDLDILFVGKEPIPLDDWVENLLLLRCAVLPDQLDLLEEVVRSVFKKAKLFNVEKHRKKHIDDIVDDSL